MHYSPSSTARWRAISSNFWRMCRGLGIRQGIQALKRGTRKADEQVLEDASDEPRDELLLGHLWIIDIGLIALLHAQELLLRQASHRVHHRRVGDPPTLIQDLEDVSHGRALVGRTCPDEFHDLGLQGAQHLADARSIRPKHTD